MRPTLIYWRACPAASLLMGTRIARTTRTSYCSLANATQVPHDTATPELRLPLLLVVASGCSSLKTVKIDANAVVAKLRYGMTEAEMRSVIGKDPEFVATSPALP